MKNSIGATVLALFFSFAGIALLAAAVPINLSSRESNGAKRLDPPLGNHIGKTAANVLDDLCRFHGDQVVRPSSVVPFAADHSGGGSAGNSARIDVLHEIFDPTFGLAPHISYTGREHGLRILKNNSKSAVPIALAAFLTHFSHLVP